MSRILENAENQITNGFHEIKHQAVDVVKKTNQLANIIAHSAGKVVWVQTGYRNAKGSSGNASYGNAVKIKHNNGYYTLYAHLNRVDVKVGQEVKQGQVIGYMGDSGNAYGAHLHFELRNEKDVRINPTTYIDSDLPNSAVKAENSAVNSAEEVYIVKSGDTLSAIAKKYNTTYQELAKYNNIANPNIINVGQQIRIPSKQPKIVYVVKSGDTLSSIAKKYNTTWQKIYEKNKNIIGSNPNLIRVGQKLEI